MLGIIAVGALVVGGAGAIISGTNARREAQRSRRAQETLAQQQMRQQRLGQLRQSQMARAQVTQASASSGTAESSGMAGALASIGTQSASNVSFLQSSFRLQQDIGRFQGRAQTRQAQQQMYGQLFQIGAMAYAAAGAGGAGASGAESSTPSNQFGVQSGGYAFT